MDRPSLVPRSSPWFAASQYQVGLKAFESGRYLEAIAALTRIVDRNDLPGTLGRFYLARAHHEQGLAELRSRRYAAAISHLRSALALNPGAVDLSRHLAAGYVGQRRFDLAAVEYEKQNDDPHRAADTAIRLALSLWKQGQHQQAIETLLSATRAEPHRADLALQLGLLYAGEDDYANAAAVLGDAVRLAPFNVEARQHLGLTFGAMGQFAAALEHLGVAHQLRPNDAYLALQWTYACRAAQAEGIDPSVETAAAQPMQADPHAIERLGQILVAEPDFPEAFLSLPQTGVDGEIFSLLAATMEWALERHPECADLHYHCSRVYGRLGRAEDAIDAARRAVERNPQLVPALIQLGRLYMETDRTQEAIVRLESAIERGGDYPDVHYLLGQIYRRTGDKQQALKSFERALELNAGYREARRALNELIAA